MWQINKIVIRDIDHDVKKKNTTYYKVSFFSGNNEQGALMDVATVLAIARGFKIKAHIKGEQLDNIIKQDLKQSRLFTLYENALKERLLEIGGK